MKKLFKFYLGKLNFRPKNFRLYTKSLKHFRASVQTDFFLEFTVRNPGTDWCFSIRNCDIKTIKGDLTIATYINFPAWHTSEIDISAHIQNQSWHKRGEHLYLSYTSTSPIYLYVIRPSVLVREYFGLSISAKYDEENNFLWRKCGSHTSLSCKYQFFD